MDKLIANRYEILEQLGAGGMGAVYLVQDKLRNQQVALKQMLTSDDHQRLAITREFRTLSTLRHPNIVGVIEYGFHEKQPYFTMDYVAHAQPFNPLEEQIIEGFIQILQALAYLHRRGILHRDLKPANVLVTEEGIVKLLDFGLARDTVKPKSATIGGISGTLSYMSPEVLNEETPSIGSDLWALGVMLCEILTGHHPFNNNSPMTLVLSIIQQAPNLEGLDEEFSRILERLLAKDPNERYPNAQAVIQDLYFASDAPIPAESVAQRESFLQSAAFVGREREYQWLVDALHATSEQQGQLYLIGGEAGSGKSRLLEELRTRALVDGFIVLQGQGVEGGGLPYQLWRDIARNLVLVAPMSDLNASIFKDLVPDIATLLGREVVDAPEPEANANRDRLMASFLERFRSIAAPTLLLLEDLHWASESLELLKLFLPHFAELPILVIASYREDEHSNLPKDFPHAQTLKLERLSLAAIRQLSVSMLGEEHATPQLVARLAEESEGNALFMVEVVRALAEEAGSLQDIHHDSLPEKIFAGGILAVLQRRLAKVPLWALKALQQSAIIGRKIDLRLLLQLGMMELENWLQVCTEGLVLEPYQGDWRFSHDHLRDVLVQDLPDLPQYHEQIAQAIETVYPNNVDYAETLAEHWRLAGNIEKEVFYILKAVKPLIGITADYERAKKLLERAIAYHIADTLGELRFYLGQIAVIEGRYDLALQNFQLGLASATTPTVQARLLFGTGYAHMRQGKYSEAIYYTQEAKTLAEEQKDYINLGESLINLGFLARLKGDFPLARTYLENSLALGREIQNKRIMSHSLANLGVVTINQDDFAAARAYYEEATIIRREMADRWGIAMSLTNLGELSFFEGNYPLAQTTYLESYLLFREIRDKDVFVYTLTGLVMTWVELGDYQTARNYLLESLMTVTETDSVPMMFVTLLAASYYLQEPARATAWIGLLTAQASAEITGDRRFKTRSKALEETMGAVAFKSAFEQGKALNIKTEVAILLKELEDSADFLRR